MESIAVARSKHDHLVSTVLCEKLDEISQLNTCFRGEKSQSKETMKQAAILDPITSKLRRVIFERSELIISEYFGAE